MLAQWMYLHLQSTHGRRTHRTHMVDVLTEHMVDIYLQNMYGRGTYRIW